MNPSAIPLRFHPVVAADALAVVFARSAEVEATVALKMDLTAGNNLSVIATLPGDAPNRLYRLDVRVGSG